MEVQDLVAAYGARRVLDGVSLDIPHGQVTVILGGSGSGKTTLLRHMVGLEIPLEGHIFIKGRSLGQMNIKEDLEVRKKTGVLFQNGALLNSMTVAQNISLPLREHTDLSGEVIEIIIRLKLDQVGLTGFGELMPGQLSGGMKKRAGLARALAMDPEIIFVDEPSAGLDPITAAGLDRLLLDLKKTFDMTLVVVTHELASIFTIADRVCMIDGGQAIFTGTLDELKEADHPRIRQFLERKAEEFTRDPAEYLRALTGEV